MNAIRAELDGHELVEISFHRFADESAEVMGGVCLRKKDGLVRGVSILVKYKNK